MLQHAFQGKDAGIPGPRLGEEMLQRQFQGKDAGIPGPRGGDATACIPK